MCPKKKEGEGLEFHGLVRVGEGTWERGICQDNRIAAGCGRGRACRLGERGLHTHISNRKIDQASVSRAFSLLSASWTSQLLVDFSSIIAIAYCARRGYYMMGLSICAREWHFTEFCV